MMNMTNTSTGFTLFMLKTGRSPRLLPPLVTSLRQDSDTADQAADVDTAQELIESMENYTAEARDALLHAKIRQAHKVNKGHSPDLEFEVGGGGFC
jgi:hypothetical protein